MVKKKKEKNSKQLKMDEKHAFQNYRPGGLSIYFTREVNLIGISITNHRLKNSGRISRIDRIILTKNVETVRLIVCEFSTGSTSKCKLVTRNSTSASQYYVTWELHFVHDFNYNLYCRVIHAN